MTATKGSSCRESVFFRNVIPGRLTVLQSISPHSYTHGHKLYSMGDQKERDHGIGVCEEGICLELEGKLVVNVFKNTSSVHTKLSKNKHRLNKKKAKRQT